MVRMKTVPPFFLQKKTRWIRCWGRGRSSSSNTSARWFGTPKARRKWGSSNNSVRWIDQLRQGEQEAAVANELDDSEAQTQRQEVQEEAFGIAEEEDTEGAEAEEEENQRNEHIMFRGIEFLERDPALRPQIWQYPNDQRDQVRQAYLQLGPMQPLLKKYKPSGP